MPSCAIKWCGKSTTTSSYTKDGVSFHRFPKDDIECKEIWIKATHRDNYFPTKRSVVCSRHFTSDCFESLKNRRRLFRSSVPTLYLPVLTLPNDSQNAQKELYLIEETTNQPYKNTLLPGAPGPSADKRARLASGDTQTTGPNEDCLEGQHAATVPTVEQIQIPAYRDTRQVHASHECDFRKELPIHLDIRCNVCLNDIVGFRYTCVQCVDWDMCASCEARGEHPDHYVLRLPAPKPKAESDTVLEALRKYIDELLQLNNEMHEIVFKEEPIEVTEEMDLDIEEHHLSPELDDCTVPELTTNRETSIRNVPATVHAEVKKEIDTDVEEPHLTPEFDNRDVPEVRTHRESSIRSVPSSEETIRHTSSPDGSDEQDEVAEAVRSLTGKITPNDRHLVIYKTLERNKNKIETNVKESAE